ncbi:cupredoxin domain-containing protein [Nocardia sp. NPDC052566]|uniref:cupredoxin domain-containing protein n=1 Tax=Nocardia sp. NPDC052566 TaxID=3364330 RepID=UPI0037C61FAB
MSTPLRRRTRFAQAACVTAVAAFAVACGSSTGDKMPEAVSTQITIAEFHFQPPASVAPGAKITIRNQDRVEHSVTSDAAGLFSTDVEGNETATFTAPSTPGEFTFFCKYHPAMRSTLIVK